MAGRLHGEGEKMEETVGSLRISGQPGLHKLQASLVYIVRLLSQERKNLVGGHKGLGEVTRTNRYNTAASPYFLHTAQMEILLHHYKDRRKCEAPFPNLWFGWRLAKWNVLSGVSDLLGNQFAR